MLQRHSHALHRLAVELAYTDDLVDGKDYAIAILTAQRAVYDISTAALDDTRLTQQIEDEIELSRMALHRKFSDNTMQL